MRSFKLQVLAVVRSIPVGSVATYGDVARLAGRPGAARAVGNIMCDCSDPSVPCHRVVAAGGRLGGYGGHETLKAQLLRAEGLRVSRTRVRDFARARWKAAARRTARRTSAGARSSHPGSPPARRRAGR